MLISHITSRQISWGIMIGSVISFVLFTVVTILFSPLDEPYTESEASFFWIGIGLALLINSIGFIILGRDKSDKTPDIDGLVRAFWDTQEPKEFFTDIIIDAVPWASGWAAYVIWDVLLRDSVPEEFQEFGPFVLIFNGN